MNSAILTKVYVLQGNWDARWLNNLLKVSNGWSQHSHPLCVSVEKSPTHPSVSETTALFEVFLSFLEIVHLNTVLGHQRSTKANGRASWSCFWEGQCPSEEAWGFHNVLTQVSSRPLYNRRGPEVYFPQQMLWPPQRHSSVYVYCFCTVVLWSHV